MMHIAHATDTVQNKKNKRNINTIASIIIYNEIDRKRYPSILYNANAFDFIILNFLRKNTILMVDYTKE